MYPAVCPMCKSNLYGLNSQSNVTNIKGFRKYESQMDFKKKSKERHFRTSTPISELEDQKTTSSDSVNDFFYQSWKSGLYSKNPKTSYQVDRNFNQFCHKTQPIYYPTQVIYVNTVIYQPVLPTFPQQLGYRPDGTFGVLPVSWSYGIS